MKNQNSQIINLTEFEKTTPTYVYALEQLKTLYGLNYTFIESLSDELNEQTKSFQFWSTSYQKSQIKFDRFNKQEFSFILAFESLSGYPETSPIRK